MIRRIQHSNADDSGAVLVLAVLFVFVVGIIGGAIAGFAGSSLAQASVEGTDRSASYAGESAIQVAIQQIRGLTSPSNAPGYSNGGSINPCPTTTVPIPENGTSVSYNVMCAVGQAPLPFERIIVFAACPAGTAPSNCLTGQAAFKPAVQNGAVVSTSTTFADLANGCTIPSPASCFVPGTSVDVGSWDLAQSNN